MNNLEDFDTLAEAQAYEVTTYSKITPGQASQYFGLTGMLDALEENADSKTPLELEPDIFTTIGALCRTVLASANGTGFACDPTTYDGVVNRGAAQLLLDAGVFTSQTVVDKFWEKGATITNPFENATAADFDEAKDTGETISLSSNNDQHKIKLSISTKPRKPTDIVIQQRFGLTDQNLTDWVEVGRVRGVEYTTDHIAFYESGMIPKSPAAYRELRAVCALTLGVEQVID